MSQIQDLPGTSREPFEYSRRGSKRRAPAWSEPEIKSLLELWSEEEALQSLHSCRRNAAIYGRMAQGLAKLGHYPRNQEQVRFKVKELRQGYARAKEESSRFGVAPHYCPYYKELEHILGSEEACTPLRLTQPRLADPVVNNPQQDQEQSRESRDGDLVKKEKDDDNAMTLILELVTQSPEASQVSSDIKEEAAAGPSRQDGGNTPAPPASRGQSSCRHWRVYTELMKQQVEALEDLNNILRERTVAEARWHDRLLEELVHQRTSICATIREVCGLLAPVLSTTPPAHHNPTPLNLPFPPKPPFPVAPPSPPVPPTSSPSSPLVPPSPSPPGPLVPQHFQSHMHLPASAQHPISRPTQSRGCDSFRLRGGSSLQARKHHPT